MCYSCHWAVSVSRFKIARSTAKAEQTTLILVVPGNSHWDRISYITDIRKRERESYYLSYLMAVLRRSFIRLKFFLFPRYLSEFSWFLVSGGWTDMIIEQINMCSIKSFDINYTILKWWAPGMMHLQNIYWNSKLLQR